MQLVVVDVCARCSKVPPFAVLATAKPANAKAILTRTAISSLRDGNHIAAEAEEKCAL